MTANTVTIDPDRLAALEARIRREVDEGLLPSCQAAVGLDGEIVWSRTFGDATDATRYAIFSCTKALVAGVMWQLFGEDRCAPSDLVTTHWPEFGANGKADVTIAHLLAHTAGFPRAPLGPRDWSSREQRVSIMESWRLSWEPGTRFEYHPTSAHWVLGELINRLDGRPVGEAIHARISVPLGLTTLALGVALEDQHDIATLADVGAFPTPDELREVFGVDSYDLGEVTPEVLLALHLPAARTVGVPGGGGVSTAVDIARFYQALLHDPAQLWDPAWLADGTTNVRNTFRDPVLGHVANRTLGLIVAGDDGQAFMRGMGHTVSPRAFGHNGAGGQIAFADPDTGLSFAYLTNGLDRHILRESRRVSGIASRAAALTHAGS